MLLSIEGCKDFSFAESRQYFLQSWHLMFGSLDCLVQVARVKADSDFSWFCYYDHTADPVCLLCHLLYDSLLLHLSLSFSL